MESLAAVRARDAPPALFHFAALEWRRFKPSICHMNLVMKERPSRRLALSLLVALEGPRDEQNPVTLNHVMRRDGVSEKRGMRQRSPVNNFIANVLHLTPTRLRTCRTALINLPICTTNQIMNVTAFVLFLVPEQLVVKFDPTQILCQRIQQCWSDGFSLVLLATSLPADWPLSRSPIFVIKLGSPNSNALRRSQLRSLIPCFETPGWSGRCPTASRSFTSVAIFSCNSDTTEGAMGGAGICAA